MLQFCKNISKTDQQTIGKVVKESLELMAKLDPALSSPLFTGIT